MQNLQGNVLNDPEVVSFADLLKSVGEKCLTLTWNGMGFSLVYQPSVYQIISAT